MHRTLQILILLPLLSIAAAQDSAVDHFERRVRPILNEHCIRCHGPKKQEGGLRLDSRAGALKGSDLTGAVVDPASPLESTLLKAVRHEDGLTMPPDRRLSDRQIRDITQWLKAGAPWPDSKVDEQVAPSELWKRHWAAQPIQPVEVPHNVIRGSTHPIDSFVQRRLTASGLQLSPRASARDLIRRAQYVLTGLPPSYGRVTKFEKAFENEPDTAMAELVDSLLASPHYGERWARHWLDVARYADTRGYVRLSEEPNFYYAWTYRDYVVRAFNSDMPFDQFIREQLAADLMLEGNDNTSLAALGFLTLGRRFTGNQHDIIDDRIDVVSRGLMGITVSCARCHDHKFDPIPTDDYYALYGVFASTTEPADLPYLGTSAAPTEFQGDMAEYRRRRADLQQKIDQFIPATMDALRADTSRYLEAALRGRKVFLVPLPAAKGELRQTFVERWIEYLEGTRRDPTSVFALWHRLRRLEPGQFSSQARTIVQADRGNSRVRAALEQSDLSEMTDVAEAYGQLFEQTHAKWRTLLATSSEADSLPSAEEEQLRQVLYGPDSPFAMSNREILEAYLVDAADNEAVAAAYKSFDGWLAGSGKAAARAHVIYDSRRIHEPHIFIRGNPERRGRPVRRAAPSLLGQPFASPFRIGSGRLELARAIANPSNPLTARVIVNRIWKHSFGEGLVTTTSNFGLRADPPSHPDLLNYLSQQFLENGWSIKQLQRQILLSQTWQQSSTDRPSARAKDPENRLLWRANRRRLDFESLRDCLLSAAGRLDLTLGGPPSDLTSPDNVRRTLYGRINRSALPAVLQLFDFPSPDIHAARRPQTTSPQQALYLMNSPFVQQQAAALAGRNQAPDESNTRVAARLYRLVLQREPTVSEVNQCSDALKQGLKPRELAQILMVSNEFLFVD